MPYILNTPDDQKAMLDVIGVKSIEDLFDDIPADLKLAGKLRLPEALSEMEVLKHLTALGRRNTSTQQAVSFLGGGCWDHFIPAAIDKIVMRSEFYTAYTPYQPEASQGLLQAFYEYQSLICDLTAMDVSNASMYDGASALAEAVLMARSINERATVLLPATLHPEYRQVLDTYLRNSGMTIRTIPIKDGVCHSEDFVGAAGDQVSSVVVQNPNFFGHIEDVKAVAAAAHKLGALCIACVDPISLGLLLPPGECHADIVVGDGQPLGIPQSYGGPSFGFMACHKNYVRKMPGRIIGRTVDVDHKPGFVLTLQTREQHIRREKATSNICTNHALNALRATVYLCLMGPEGIREAADLCLQKSHYARDRIAEVDGFEPAFSAPFFKEFVIRCPVDAEKVCDALLPKGILAGLPLGRFDAGMKNCLLVSVTEKRMKDEIDGLAKALAEMK
ncbi:MAG: aminomethyl-transferring glycine dehydrogenase subunit GcvPA [Planctomycetota bacterium]